MAQCCSDSGHISKTFGMFAGLGLAFGLTIACAWFSQADSQSEKPSGPKMASVAKAFAQSLDDNQKAAALMPFDSPERTRWHFVPLQDKDKNPTRKGLRMEKMTDEQRELALALLKTGTSDRGYAEARQIMSLEAVLDEMEKTKVNIRNPLWYFVSVFGEPGDAKGWGWRFEGHHITLNVTLMGDQVVSATPSVFCSNPAVIRSGKKVGVATLPGTLSKAETLVQSLSEDQKREARANTLMAEVEQANAKAPQQPEDGIRWTAMDDNQKKLLHQVLREYTGRMPADVEAATWRRVTDSQDDSLRFAFAIEADKPGKPMTYRVSGKGFLVQFLNVQSDAEGTPANHFHTALRRPSGDFALAP